MCQDVYNSNQNAPLYYCRGYFDLRISGVPLNGTAMLDMFLEFELVDHLS